MKRQPFKRALRATGRAIGSAALFIAPHYVGRRIAIRDKLIAHKRALDRMGNLSSREMGQRDRFRGAKWLTSRLSPDSEAEDDLVTIRDRSRDLYLNDAIAAGYVKGRVTNVVGTGINPQGRVKATKGVTTSTQALAFNTDSEALFKRWARKADVSGRKSLWQILRLAQRCKDRDGEAFIVMSDVPHPSKPIPLALEVVSVTRISTPPEQEGAPNIRLGIERDENDNPVAYYIETTDPDDTKKNDFIWRRVPADRVCHYYEEEEPGQSRGYPDMGPSAATLKDIKDFDEATVIGKQVEACYAAIHKTADPMGAALGASSGTDANGNRLEELAPGAIYRIGQDEEVTFSNPNRGSSSDDAFTNSQYHRIAAGLNYSFEALIKNFGKATYSSARAVRLDDQAVFKTGQKLLVETILDRIWERFLVEAVVTDQLPVTTDEYLKAPWVYEAHEWIPTGWPRVDKLKESQADKVAVAEGFGSRTQINRAHGDDDDEIRDQRLREKIKDADAEKELMDYRKNIGLDTEPELEGGDDGDQKD